MVKNITEKGSLSKPLIVYNRTESRAIDLAKTLSQQIIPVSTVKEAVEKSTIIFICLGDDAAVESTVDAVLKSTDVAGKLFVDCSTIHPDTTRRLAQLLESSGASFAACPVFGTPLMADAGKLLCVLAGRKECVDRVTPYCTGVMGHAVIDLSTKSENPGMASMLKVMGNTMISQMVSAISESLVVAEKSGLGVDALHSFLEVIFPGPYVDCSKRMISGDYHQRKEPLFAVDLARKDARHAMEMAKAVDARMKGVERVDEMLQAVKSHSGEKGDLTCIYGVAREAAGMKFENN
ncbi:6-phosphogluconate dehydrogenase family protein [Arthroderma uncinatum]|uniref:6-phosphogluconate dehydrogenase family protein n=1 Tax=Arthroderma uncinatum TaxID=74035 RepID=UPI00144A746E|nr:6-phosphogluconate dehydrogenase family protein [Arthroderma uncinatum]KAF3482846.1 6-phosphogluconate dehydrogenase family protein [Arthroderma uncinatum]